MNHQDKLNAIEKLIPHLVSYNQNQSMKIDMEEREELKTVYKEIFGVPNPNVHCLTCIVAYLNNLLAWHEVEKPKVEPAPEAVRSVKKKRK